MGEEGSFVQALQRIAARIAAGGCCCYYYWPCSGAAAVVGSGTDFEIVDEIAVADFDVGTAGAGAGARIPAVAADSAAGAINVTHSHYYCIRCLQCTYLVLL